MWLEVSVAVIVASKARSTASHRQGFSVQQEDSAIPSVLIVDDHEIVRQGVRKILEMQDDWEVCGEASNGQEALRLNEDLKPDAIIMDVTMPVMNGLEATKEITNANPDSKVLIFTMHEPLNLLPMIRRAGAKGVLTKSKAASDLTPALKTILAGQTYFH